MIVRSVDMRLVITVKIFYSKLKQAAEQCFVFQTGRILRTNDWERESVNGSS